MGAAAGGKPPLHKLYLQPRAILNRAYALIYSCAVVALFYHRSLQLLRSTTALCFALNLAMLIADAILALLWVASQGFRWRPVRRREFPENLSAAVGEGNLPKLDVFVCTADPHKEPPIRVANTVLSAMALDYPPEKLSVYVSDDGASELTLFAFMEAAEFARHWLPFCKKHQIVDTNPEVYFASDDCRASPELKKLYEKMRVEVDAAVARGSVGGGGEAFAEWRKEGFTSREHPTVIRRLLPSDRDRDVAGDEALPNLVYVAREKTKDGPHHFKAGALNALLRESGKLSNSPVILTLDCDMYCNDPQVARRALCYLADDDDEEMRNCAYVQFPQRYRGLNASDIYGCEQKRMFQINPLGMDAFLGPDYFGTCSFFRRRALFGPLSLPLPLPLPLPDETDGPPWGQQVGFRYGSLVEDFFTGYLLHCEGWRSVYCDPAGRAAFLGEAPINLEDALSQIKRWSVGLLEIVFSKYNPLSFGIRRIPLPMALSYAYYAYDPLSAIPVAAYGLLPQLAHLAGLPPLFPKASDSWFYVYLFLFLGAYGRDLMDFLLNKGTIQRWWSDQRMWMIRGASSHLLALLQLFFQLLGLSTSAFNLTNKVVDEEQSRRYQQGVFEFGPASPLFVPIVTVAVVNLVSFVTGVAGALGQGRAEEALGQLLVAGFVVVNSWPVYGGMILRGDEGRIHARTTMVSVVLASFLYFMVSFPTVN